VTDRALRPTEPAAEKDKPQGFFEAACGLLNGEVRIPRASRRENQSASREDGTIDWGKLRPSQRKPPPLRALYAFRYSGPADAGMLSFLGRPDPSTVSRRSLYRTLDLDAIGRKDVLDLAEFLRVQFRYYMRSPVRGRFYSECTLPAVREKWPPRPSRDEWKAAWERMTPRVKAFCDFLRNGIEWFGWQSTFRFFLWLEAPPRTPQEAYLFLWAAFLLPLGFPRGLIRERIVPCLACSRFFVATRPNAETCSDACRQRLYRASIGDEEGRRRLREQAKKHKRAQRQRERGAQNNQQRARRAEPLQSATSTARNADQKEAVASRTSRRPR